MTPSKPDPLPSRALDSSPGAQASPSAETPGRSDAAVAETSPVSVRPSGADTLDPSIRAPIVGQSLVTGDPIVTPAPRTVTAQQKLDLLWQMITEMRRDMHMSATPTPAVEYGAPDGVGPVKSECDLFPVHAPREGTDDARGLAKVSRPENGDASLPHAHVGVVTRGQAAADDDAANPPPMQVQTERAAPSAVTEILTAPSPPALEHMSDQAVDEEYRRRFLRSQSSMTRPFNQNECYQRVLSSDPPVRSESTGSTPSYYTPSIPRMQAAGGGGGDAVDAGNLLEGHELKARYVFLHDVTLSDV